MNDVQRLNMELNTIASDENVVLSYRTKEFLHVAVKVIDHIESYTVPQYGDYPSDQITTATEDDILHDMSRYIKRAKTNARGPEEAQRDLLKIIHYSAILYKKREREATEGVLK